MRRMYFIVGSIFLLFVWAISCLGQKLIDDSPVFDRTKRRLELREQAHRRMMDKLFKGIGPDEDMFKDMEKLMEGALQDSFSGFDTFSSNSFKSEWSENKTGRVLTIIPEQGQQLDIDVNTELITIKGKTEQKSDNGSSISSFSNSFSVPDDCDGAKVKMTQVKDKILIVLPYKSGKAVIIQPKVLPDGRTPLQPSPGDIEI